MTFLKLLKLDNKNVILPHSFRHFLQKKLHNPFNTVDSISLWREGEGERREEREREEKREREEQRERGRGRGRERGREREREREREDGP
jgi:hypothetical protein